MHAVLKETRRILWNPLSNPLELELTDGCKVICGYWDLNPGFLEEQSGPLTVEPPLQTLVSHLLMVYKSSLKTSKHGCEEERWAGQGRGLAVEHLPRISSNEGQGAWLSSKLLG